MKPHTRILAFFAPALAAAALVAPGAADAHPWDTYQGAAQMQPLSQCVVALEVEGSAATHGWILDLAQIEPGELTTTPTGRVHVTPRVASSIQSYITQCDELSVCDEFETVQSSRFIDAATPDNTVYVVSNWTQDLSVDLSASGAKDAAELALSLERRALKCS